MRELLKIIDNQKEEVSQEVEKEISKFSKCLGSYIHVPTNEKEIKRMLPFSKNKDLVIVIVEILEKYPYPKDATYPFDIISYWYCVAMFLYAESKKTNEFIVELSKHLQKENHKDLWQLRRILNSFENKQKYAKQLNQIESYLESYCIKLRPKLESYQWAKNIGLELPNSLSDSYDLDIYWNLRFMISTDGEFRLGNDLSGKEKNERLTLSTSVYSFHGDSCWGIELKNWNNTISAWWPNLSEQKIRVVKNNGMIDEISLRIKPSILNLKEVILEIEKLFQVKFQRKIILKTFRGKIKNKNSVQKWLME